MCTLRHIERNKMFADGLRKHVGSLPIYHLLKKNVEIVLLNAIKVCILILFPIYFMLKTNTIFFSIKFLNNYTNWTLKCIFLSTYDSQFAYFSSQLFSIFGHFLDVLRHFSTAELRMKGVILLFDYYILHDSVSHFHYNVVRNFNTSSVECKIRSIFISFSSCT